MTKKLNNDVIVYVNGVIYKPSENYAYQLICTKTSGWELFTLKELKHLVRLLEPLEEAGTLNVPGLATLNGARKAITEAEAK